MLVRSLAGGLFCCYFFGQEDYVPELRQIGLDPAVQGVPVKKKLSVHKKGVLQHEKIIDSKVLQRCTYLC